MKACSQAGPHVPGLGPMFPGWGPCSQARLQHPQLPEEDSTSSCSVSLDLRDKKIQNRTDRVGRQQQEEQQQQDF